MAAKLLDMDILVDKNLVTRKEHSCFGCYRKFPAGTIMHYQKNVYDGVIYGLHTCLTCRELLAFHFYDDFYEQGYAYEDKMSNDEQCTSMTFEEYLAYMKANYEPLDYFWRNRGVCLPLKPIERSRVLKLYKIPESRYPYPHVHTPLPGGGHVTSDAPLDDKAMDVLKKVIDHFTHDPLEGMYGV